MKNAKELIRVLLAKAGITLNGSQPWDIQVHNSNFYSRVLHGGSLALGESYMDGWWDCQSIDQMMFRIYQSGVQSQVPFSLSDGLAYVAARLLNRSKSRAYEIGQKHYDTGNDLFEKMLDKRMVYSCGYWKNASNLNEAQEAKLDLICRKIGLEKGDSVLDIGCGWGGFAKFASQKYGARVTGITVSSQQAELARQVCKGLPVEIGVQDYHKLNKKFDHIISVGMFEHVTYKNYSAYMKVASRCLKDDGLFLLHTIGNIKSVKSSDPWVNKYIFPNSMLPSVAQIADASEPYFVMEDWHSFGADYDKTLMAWQYNFVRAWPELRQKYGDRFYRMWNFYLLTFAGLFRARHFQLWQVVFSKKGVEGGYKSIR